MEAKTSDLQETPDEPHQFNRDPVRIAFRAKKSTPHRVTVKRLALGRTSGLFPVEPKRNGAKK